jgi:ABC-type transport system substrate-binding protein
MERRVVRAGVTLLLALCVAASLAATAAAQAIQTGGHLRVAYNLAPTSLDPALGRSGGDAYYWKQMFDQLVDADDQLKPRPATSLAESWDFPNPTTMVLRLRKGVKFHDGTDFTAESVKFNIERLLDEKVGATPRAAFQVVRSVEVVDPHTVRLNLKTAWGAGLGMLADRGGAMNSPAAVARLGQEYGFNPSGTGPFKLAEVVSGSHVRMVRNPAYWGRDGQGNRLPYLDEITIKIINDPSVVTAALRAGEIDLAILPYKDIAAFESTPAFRISRFPGSAIGYLFSFNMVKPPMDNVLVRRAVASAVNPEAINKAVFASRAIVARGGMWPVRSWVYDETIPRPAYDVPKARDMLKQAGYPNGFPMEALTWASETNSPAAEIVKAQLGQLGIQMNINVLSVGAATEQFYSGKSDFHLYLTSWSRYPEPDWVASLNYKSNGYYNPAKLNSKGLPYPELDKLIEAGAASYNLEERKKIYRKVNEVVLTDAWFVPMIYGVAHAGAAARVQNLETLFGWDAKFELRHLWMKK